MILRIPLACCAVKPALFFLLIPVCALGIEIDWETTSDFYSCFYELVESSDGNLVIAGHKNDQPCLFKYEFGGDTLWTCLPEPYLAGEGELKWVEECSQGYITCGWVQQTGATLDYLIALIGFEGELIWSRILDTGYDEEGYVITEGNSGVFYTTGYTFFEAGEKRDLWLLKLSSAGDTLWTVKWSNPNSCIGRGIDETSEGDVAIFAHAGRAQYLLFNGSGSLKSSHYYWEITVAGCSGMVMIPSGYCFITTWYCYVANVNCFGFINWVDSYFHLSGSPNFYGIKETRDNGFVVVGATNDYYPNKGYNYGGLIQRISAEGEDLWWDYQVRTSSYSSYYYGVIQYSSGGYVAVGKSVSKGWQVFYAPEEGISPEDESSRGLRLISVSPDPFRNVLKFEFTVSSTTDLTICIFDLQGREIDCIVSRNFSPGSYTEFWNPSENVSVGCYFAVLESTGGMIVRRVIKINT